MLGGALSGRGQFPAPMHFVHTEAQAQPNCGLHHDRRRDAPLQALLSLQRLRMLPSDNPAREPLSW